MMKFTETACRIGLFATISLTSIAEASQSSILGSYKSNGYTLDLEVDGGYHSCDPQNRCLAISHTKLSQQGETWIWKNAGYTYQITPVGSTLFRGYYTRISVKIINSNRKVIFNRIFRHQ
jgi:hypothetical protein